MWEYLRVKMNIYGLCEFQDYPHPKVDMQNEVGLDDLGREGWELASVDWAQLGGPDDFAPALLKRRKQTEMGCEFVVDWPLRDSATGVVLKEDGLLGMTLTKVMPLGENPARALLYFR